MRAVESQAGNGGRGHKGRERVFKLISTLRRCGNRAISLSEQASGGLLETGDEDGGD
jgi:hypothetical protein